VSKWRCVGCGRKIPWDGRGLFAYTCPCGATVFVDEERHIAYPASFYYALSGHSIPHIDYYLGISNYVSAKKEQVYQILKKLGAVWSWECPECRERFLKRKRMEVREGLIRIPLHPELLRALHE